MKPEFMTRLTARFRLRVFPYSIGVILENPIKFTCIAYDSDDRVIYIQDFYK